MQIHPSDTVAVALEPLQAGLQLTVAGHSVVLLDNVPQGHKFALASMEPGDSVQKYGCTIGIATQSIQPGQWVHTHNMKTGLSENQEYQYRPVDCTQPSQPPRTFQGYLRPDGRAAIRNEIWILPTVGCVNGIAQQLVAQNQHLVEGSLEGIYTFPHPFGCSQMGEDHAQTRRLLAALANHPHAAGVLVLGLGCENLTMEQFQAELGQWDDERVKFLVCQQVEDELEEGSRLLAQLAAYAKEFQRQPLPTSKLVVGLKCGGSDGLSGITANPTVGQFCDN
ncbi:MAG: altronate dehydratase family protein, partial [Candidatus Fournierella pullistercoris]|nr:altronate dehydratase family protein [Candidatus Fournierella pullistercoris]